MQNLGLNDITRVLPELVHDATTNAAAHLAMPASVQSLTDLETNVQAIEHMAHTIDRILAVVGRQESELDNLRAEVAKLKIGQKAG